MRQLWILLGSLVTTVVGVVSTAGGAGVATPKVTVMIVIFTCNAKMENIDQFRMSSWFHLNDGILPPDTPKDCDSNLHDGHRHLE